MASLAMSTGCVWHKKPMSRFCDGFFSDGNDNTVAIAGVMLMAFLAFTAVGRWLF
jgi:hypothetical protein